MHFVTKYRRWLIIIIGSLVWSLTMIKSGWNYKYGLGFWGPNGHDGVWHVALIESLSKGGWDMPIFASVTIKNYHLGFDLALAAIHRLTSIPVPLLYWQLTPPLMAILIGWCSYKFVVTWTKSESAAIWALFFTYFGGSWGWILSKGESAFWSQQAISTLINPPFALSLVLLLLGLLLIQKQRYILAALIFAILPHVKIYAGLLAFGGLLLASFKNRKLIWVFAGSLVLYLATNYQQLTTSSSLLVWQPGWYLETMMSLSDRVGWQRYYSAMTNYHLGSEWIKVALTYGIAFGIFGMGNMGTRLLAIKQIKRTSELRWEDIFLFAVIFGGGIIPMFWLQTGTPWNTIQFFYYSLFFAAILAGIAMSKAKSWILIFLVIILTLPTTWQTLKHYLPTRPPAKLSQEEFQALQFLSRQSVGTVLTYPYDSIAAKQAEANPPRPLYLYESTAYVAAFSKQPVYLEDEVNLNITNYSWHDRRQQSLDFFATADESLARKFLTDNSISYIYLAEVAKYRPRLSDTQLEMTNIFENSQVAIWKKK